MRRAHENNYLILTAATIAALTVATSNAFFAYELGALIPVSVKGISFFADGAALALASATIAAFEARAATLVLRPRPGDNRIVAAVFLLLCLCYSVGAMANHVLKLQRLQETQRVEAGRDRDLAKDALTDAENIRDAIADEIKEIGAVRAPAEIEAAIAAVEVSSRTLRKSDDCTAAWARTADGCKDILELRTELARAQRKAELAPKHTEATEAVQRARAALARTSAPAAPGASEQFLAHYVAWILAAVIQACATFGFALAVRSRQPEPVRMPRPNPPAPSAAPAQVAPSYKPRANAGRRSLDLLDVLQKVKEGVLQIQGADVQPDGWLRITQSALAIALGTSKTTVNNRVAELEASGKIVKQTDGRGTLFKIVYPPISAVN